MNLVISQGDFQAAFFFGGGGGTRLLLATNNEMWEEREEVKEVRISKKGQELAKI